MPGGPPDTHVMPIDDLREHDETRTCWCGPRLETADDLETTIVVHHALDGRELIEQHGLQ